MKALVISSLAISFLFSSCGSGVSLKSLHNNITEIQVIRINQDGNKEGQIVSVKEPKKIKKLLGFVGNSDAPFMKCGHDYEMHCFQKDGSSFLIEVNSDELCRTAVFNYEDITQSRFFSEEGVDALLELF